MLFLALIISTYLLGCLNASFYLAKWVARVDIRKVGSGNAGSRNLSRSLGLPFAALAFIWDGGKAFLAVYGAIWFVSDGTTLSLISPLLALCAVIAGHIWPIQLAWRGGKGLACLLGGLLSFEPAFFGLCLLFFLIMYCLLRSSFRWRQPDAAVFISVLFLPFLFFLYQGFFWQFLFSELLVPCFLLGIISAMVLVAHRQNISDVVMPFVLAPIQDVAHDDTKV
ncbi:glycerol-3-phosphate acyltransferase [Undibacterium sp. Di24W]|uniref:glycerol-3-phosphate acyltransferase n=1 Tax=Undibacterium sp. Di24W TaxID=3413033 RepID=UPI003BEF6763